MKQLKINGIGGIFPGKAATELRGQLRFQAQLGNEGNAELILRQAQDD
jgi:hypothetical protein